MGGSVKVYTNLALPQATPLELHELVLDPQYTENLEKRYSHKDQRKLMKPLAPRPVTDSPLLSLPSFQSYKGT